MDGSQEKDHAEELLNAPPRVLLVDDEPGLRTAVQAYFEDEGFIVSTAADGEEGWEKAQSELPDVVLSDVMMPRVDGFGLLKLLREDERLGGTPVIFLTAKGMTADRTQGYLAGVDDYIPKPFDPRVLLFVAPAVAKAAMDSGIAERPIDLKDYEVKLQEMLGEIASL